MKHTAAVGTAVLSSVIALDLSEVEAQFLKRACDVKRNKPRWVAGSSKPIQAHSSIACAKVYAGYMVNTVQIQRWRNGKFRDYGKPVTKTAHYEYYNGNLAVTNINDTVSRPSGKKKGRFRNKTIVRVFYGVNQSWEAEVFYSKEKKLSWK